MNREQETLWDTVKYFTQLEDANKAETLLRTTLEKSMRLMNIYTPIISDLRFSIPDEKHLDQLRHLDMAIRKKISTSSYEQTFEELLDYIQMISEMTEDAQDTNKKMVASILAKKTKQKVRLRKTVHSPLDKISPAEVKKESNHPYYTTSEAAHKLGLSDQTVRRMCESGKFNGAYRSEGGHWRIPEDNFITTKEQDQKVDKLFKQLDRKNREAGGVNEFDL
ncbi:helix-turn-helix domain-containing protein [Lentibacillus salinarum]|uniref:Helix-turn-helix domain-containing protein n=1 Tax=Lentibacillus salinarum TaxID=446820 RepID=A0ABW3ZWU9_9BACI